MSSEEKQAMRFATNEQQLVKYRYDFAVLCGFLKGTGQHADLVPVYIRDVPVAASLLLPNGQELIVFPDGRWYLTDYNGV